MGILFKDKKSAENLCVSETFYKAGKIWDKNPHVAKKF
tara:strand:- start:374 stop:487 length:114 start_codon:yes stop_codon:yes gene_type:complete